MGAIAAFDVQARLGEIRCPTRVIVGERQPSTTPAAAEEVRAGIAGAKVLVLPGVSHMIQLEAADEVNAALLWSFCTSRGEMSLLDVANGVLRPCADVVLRRGMISAEIEALGLPRGRNFDFKNGYTARGVGLLPYAGRMLYYSLKLHEGMLYAVEFGIHQETALGQFESQPEVQREHARFLQEELGEPDEIAHGGLRVTYRFAWGSVGAYWDAKGGMSSMMLRWEAAGAGSL